MARVIFIRGELTKELSMMVRNQIQKYRWELINLRIDSPGGYVEEGFKLIKTINAHNGGIYATVSNSADSMASLISLSCDYLIMDKNATMLIHPPRIDGQTKDYFRTSDKTKTGYSFAHLGHSELVMLGMYYDQLRFETDRDLIRFAFRNETTLNAKQVKGLFKNVYII